MAELLIRKAKNICFVLDADGSDVSGDYAASLSRYRELNLSSFSLPALGHEGELYPTDCLELSGESLAELSHEERIALFLSAMPQDQRLTFKQSVEQQAKLFEPFTSLKARTGYDHYEFNNKNDLFELWAKERLEANRPIAVQPKYDGLRLLIHWEGDRVAIYTEDKKRDRASILPDVVTEVRSLPIKSGIVDVELVLWREDQPIPRREMIRVIVGKTPIKGEDVRINIHDVLYLDGQPLNTKPYSERLAALDKMLPKDKKHLRKATTWTAKAKADFMTALDKAVAYPGSEGAMVKTMDSDYPLRGRTREETADWGKLKMVSELHVQVIGRTRKPNPWPDRSKRNLEGEEALKAFRKLQKDSQTFYYRCAVLSYDKLIPIDSQHKLAPGDLTLKFDAEHEGGVWKGTDDPQIWEMAKGFEHRERGDWAYGNTYAIKLDPGPKLGDIITVAPILMRAWKDPEGKEHYSWTFPRVREYDPTRKKPDTVADVEKIVQRSPKTLQKSIRPFGHPGGKTLLVKHIRPLIPKHQTYVEPYCGSATIFFAKDKAPKSVLGDMDPEIIAALRFIRGASSSDIEWLRKQSWRPSKGRWKFLKDQKPVRKQERFYRFLYLNYNSWADSPAKGFAASSQPVSMKREMEKIQAAGQKLKGNVTIALQDAFTTMRQNDSVSTFHYVDPPYFGSGDLEPYGGKAPEPEKLAKFLKGLRGKWLLSMHDNPRVRAAFKGSTIKSVSVGMRYSVYSRKTRSGQAPKTRKELLIGNYDFAETRKLSEAFNEASKPSRFLSEGPSTAEPGHAWCVIWAEGRAIACYRHKDDAEKFRDKQSPSEVGQFGYCDLTGTGIRPYSKEGVREAKAKIQKFNEAAQKPSQTVPKSFRQEGPEKAEAHSAWCVKWDTNHLACFTTRKVAAEFQGFLSPREGLQLGYCDLADTSIQVYAFESDMPPGEGDEPTHKEQRSEAERKFGDPYLVHQPPDKTFPFVYMHHERGIWTLDELKSLRAELTKARSDSSLIPDIWRKYKPVTLAGSLATLKRRAQAAADKRGDVSAAVHGFLDEKVPKSLPPLDRILNVGNVHGDWRMRSPEGEYLIGYTVDAPSIVLQFASGQKYVYPIRDKFLENRPGDKIVAHRKCPNPLCDEERYLQLVESAGDLIEAARASPVILRRVEEVELELPLSQVLHMEFSADPPSISLLLQEATQPLVWLTIVNPKRFIYWAPPGAVGATAKTGARFIFADFGKCAYGVRKTDYHEGFFWFDRTKKLSGRWGAQILAARPEYTKIGKEGDWWMINRVTVNPRPYILQYSRESKERQAQKERLKHIVWNADLLKVLKADPLGRRWLGPVTDEKLEEKWKEFAAGDGEFRLAKSLSFSSKLFHSPASERHLFVYGAILIPGKTDAQGHHITEKEIAKAIRTMGDISFDLEHAEKVSPNDLRLTQIFQAPVGFKVNGQRFKRGTAIAEIEVLSPKIRRRIFSGEIRGFSISGKGAMDNSAGLYDVKISKISLVSVPAIQADFIVKIENA